jgi:hypothetical protein
MGLTAYDESLCSRLYPGNRLSQYVLQPTVLELEQLLALPKARRRQVCLRLDGGFGTDDNIAWVLGRGYQLLAKGLSGSRAAKWGHTIPDWQTLEPQRRWVALSPQQLHFCCPTRTIAVRWLDSGGKVKHGLYIVTDLERPIAEVTQLYDLRGGFETDIREDKQGLLLTHRRKRLWEAQETLALLNDLAHNFLVMLRRQVLADTPLAHYGLYRLIHEVLNVPGRAEFDADGTLKRLYLQQSHPHAQILAATLPKLWR